VYYSGSWRIVGAGYWDCGAIHRAGNHGNSCEPRFQLSARPVGSRERFKGFEPI